MSAQAPVLARPSIGLHSSKKEWYGSHQKGIVAGANAAVDGLHVDLRASIEVSNGCCWYRKEAARYVVGCQCFQGKRIGSWMVLILPWHFLIDVLPQVS